MLHTEEHPGQADPDDTVPLVLRDVRGRRDRLLDAGVVERRVQSSERLDGVAQGRRDVVFTGDVAGEGQCPAARFLDDRAVSRSPSAERSARATRAPARAKATAVVRPMPEPAPVTKATLPVQVALLTVMGRVLSLAGTWPGMSAVRCSGLESELRRLLRGLLASGGGGAPGDDPRPA
ncbi:hypothetical protein QF027_007129 [Streptomyces canus]|nr:hypothetical protein [Streptomyces canus]